MLTGMYHEFSFDLLRYQCVLIVILKDSHILLIGLD